MPHIQPLKIEMAPLAELTVSPRHTRRVTRPQLQRVKRSISKFGFIVPILIDACGRIIAGAVRVEAAKALGYSEAPSIRLEHLTPEQVEAFAIAENRLVETGEWDDDMLAVVFKDLSALDLDFGLDITGFTLPEIDLKIAGIDQGDDAADDPDDRAVPPGPSVVQHGELWTLGRHRLICGSCLETEVWTRLMAGVVAAIIIADLPYNCAITGHVSSTGKFREFAMASGEMGEAEFQAFMLQACRRCQDNCAGLRSALPC